jgi:hypothetical protein
LVEQNQWPASSPRNPNPICSLNATPQSGSLACDGGCRRRRREVTPPEHVPAGSTSFPFLASLHRNGDRGSSSFLLCRARNSRQRSTPRWSGAMRKMAAPPWHPSPAHVCGTIERHLGGALCRFHARAWTSRIASEPTLSSRPSGGRNGGERDLVGSPPSIFLSSYFRVRV